ncbi:Hypothetical predicted protein [Olea europaea subsp. europaea]|uniref:Uncharacterized protein n=1 Tax=Olea europaea subsp. europaea TaxID=158383 RepID=A0A8S0VPY5_OLEEU|nr:Hypothetical predicted protein [Olea europaea subsp. europaea]
MASTTIARKGFAGLCFLSIDGLAEVGELRGSLDAFTDREMEIIAFPTRRVERHPSKATGSNYFISPSTTGVASKGKLSPQTPVEAYHPQLGATTGSG